MKLAYLIISMSFWIGMSASALESISWLDISTIKEIKNSIQRGIEFLEFSQDPNGSWSNSPTTTALCMIALSLNYSESDKNNKIYKSQKYISKFINENTRQLQNLPSAIQITSLAICFNALKALGSDMKYLDSSQVTRYLVNSSESLLKIRQAPNPATPLQLSVIFEALKNLNGFEANPLKTKLYDLQTAICEKTTNAQLSDQSMSMNPPKARNAPGIISDEITSISPNPVSNLNNCLDAIAIIKNQYMCGTEKNDRNLVKNLNWVRNSCVYANEKEGSFEYAFLLSSIFDLFNQEISNQSQRWQYLQANDIVESLLSSQLGNGSWPSHKGSSKDSIVSTAYAILIFWNISQP